MQQPAQVSPELFWDTMTAFHRTAALKAAVDLEVFTHIGRGNSTAGKIAAAADASERGIRILCDSLTVMGFLNKSGADYSLTDSSATFLDKASPAYIASAIDFIAAPPQKRGMEDLTGTVKRGGSVVTGDASMDPDSEMWVTFARAMMPLMYPTAQAVAENIGLDTGKEIKVLDIAAGHGTFGIMIAQKYPNAEVYGADWGNVLTVATENAAKFGVADRYHTVPGDAFTTDFGSDFDLILVPNFLHHFDRSSCEAFLRKLRTALKDDGMVATVEFVPNDDRVSPPPQAMFALIMLANTPGGDAYTFDELKQMFENAGFTRNKLVPLEPMPQHLVISEP